MPCVLACFGSDVSARGAERFDLGVGEKAAVSSEFVKRREGLSERSRALDDHFINWGGVDTCGRIN